MQNSSRHNRQLPVVSPGLLITVVGFTTGICSAEKLGLSGSYLFPAILLLLVIQLLIHIKKTVRHHLISRPLLGVLFFLLGLLQHPLLPQTPLSAPDHIYHLIPEKQTVGISGILAKYPAVINSSSSSPETRVLVRVKTLHRAEAREKTFQGKSRRAAGLVLLTLNGLLPEDLYPGDLIMVKAKLSRVHTFSAPGSFNYKKYLAHQSIYIKGWVKTSQNIIKINPQRPIAPSAFFLRLRYHPERIRFIIARFLDRTLDQPARGLYKAILIGDRNDVPAYVIENFAEAGCLHILAISGMHMGLLALMAISAMFWLLKRSTWLLLRLPVYKVAVSIACPALLFYALIAGFNIPVWRALLMAIAFILAVLSDRPPSLINHILIAALLILVVKPWVVQSASFQLSFGAVTAIALIYPFLLRLVDRKLESSHEVTEDNVPVQPYSLHAMINKAFHRITRWLLAGIALTTAAMLGTAPLLLFHFNRVSLVTPASNLLVEPLICLWSLPIGLASSLCMIFTPETAKLLFAIGGEGLSAAEKICALFASFPVSAVWLPTPSPIEIAAYYLFLLNLVMALYFAGKPRYGMLVFAFLCLCFYTINVLAGNWTEKDSETATITFIDVGHGAAIILHLPQDKKILIDGGSALDRRFNIGKSVIGPFLWKQKIDHLDAVVITHPHADHYNGLPFILKHFRPKELWINGTRSQEPVYRKILSLAAQLGVTVKKAETGDVLLNYNNTRLDCIHSGIKELWVLPESDSKNFSSPNDASIILRLETNQKSFLFPADIGADLAEYLVNVGSDLKADVLMAPHHGSSASMSREFISTVAPRFIVISAGRSSSFKFRPEPFYHRQNPDIEVLSTSRDGTVTFTVSSPPHELLQIKKYQVN